MSAEIGSCQATVMAASMISRVPLVIRTAAMKRVICGRVGRIRASLGWTNGRVAGRRDRTDSGHMAPLDSRATDVAVPRGLRGATADRTTMARTLAYLFFAGAVLACLSIAVPRSVDVPDVGIAGPIGAVAATAAALAAALSIRGRALLRRGSFQLVLACASALVTWAVWQQGPSSRYAVLYVLIVLYAAYFSSRL